MIGLQCNISRKIIYRITGTVLMATIFSLFLCGCAAVKSTGEENQTESRADRQDSSDEKMFTVTNFVMDTVLSETIYGSTDHTETIKDLLSEIETQKLSWRIEDSEVSNINTLCTQGASVTMSDDFYQWTKTSLDLAQKSDGAFDPTIGKLTRLWNIEGENPTVPTQAEIDQALLEIGNTHIHMQEKTISMDAGCTLDLGAVGKGIGCDVVREYLTKQEDVSGAVVAIGGSILVYGSKPDGTDWSVAVQDPEGEEGSYMGVINLSGTACVSTSGDYEKYFIQDGKRYHHILDPSTGYPSESGLSSVTIICPDEGEWKQDAGLLSDGLSTACFVLGAEKGMELLEEYGMEGVFIDKKKQVSVTECIADRFTLLHSEYTIN